MVSTMKDEVFATVSIILLCAAMKLLKKREVFLDSEHCSVSCIFCVVISPRYILLIFFFPCNKLFHINIWEVGHVLQEPCVLSYTCIYYGADADV